MAWRVLGVAVRITCLFGVSLIFLTEVSAEIVSYRSVKPDISFDTYVPAASWSTAPQQEFQWVYVYCPRCYFGWRYKPLQYNLPRGVRPYLRFGARPGNLSFMGENNGRLSLDQQFWGPRRLGQWFFYEQFSLKSLRQASTPCWSRSQHIGRPVLPLSFVNGLMNSKQWPKASFNCWR